MHKKVKILQACVINTAPNETEIIKEKIKNKKLEEINATPFNLFAQKN